MIKLKTETHTALFGADEILRKAEVGGNRVVYEGKPVSEIRLRVAYVLPRDNSSLTLGLRLPHKKTTAEYNTFSDKFEEGDFVSALVIEEGGAYKVVGLLAP